MINLNLRDISFVYLAKYYCFRFGVYSTIIAYRVTRTREITNCYGIAQRITFILAIGYLHLLPFDVGRTTSSFAKPNNPDCLAVALPQSIHRVPFHQGHSIRH